MWQEKTKTGVRYIERYKDPLTGKYKRVSVTYDKHTKRNEKDAYVKLQQLITEKTKNPTLDLTVEDLIKLFLEDKKELKASTLMRYKRALNSLPDEVKSLKAAKLEPYKIRQIDSQLTPYTVKPLKQIFSWAHKETLTPTDLSAFLKNTKHTKREKEKLYLEMTDVYDRIKKAKSLGTKQGTILAYIIEFLTLTGLRIGELLALSYSDIDGDVLTVNKTLPRDPINGALRPTSPKTKTSNRKIAINKRAKEIIKEVRLFNLSRGVRSDIIFCNRTGGYLLYGYLGAVHKDLFSGGGLHIYRHTHASLLAEKGVPLDLIQRRLGHANDTITREIYLHVTEKMKKQEIELFKNINF